jgi:hypothetical protein
MIIHQTLVTARKERLWLDRIPRSCMDELLYYVWPGNA